MGANAGESVLPMPIDLFSDTAAILISILSNSYYGMLRGQIHINLPTAHPIMSFETIKIKMAAVSAKMYILFLPHWTPFHARSSLNWPIAKGTCKNPNPFSTLN